MVAKDRSHEHDRRIVALSEGGERLANKFGRCDEVDVHNPGEGVGRRVAKRTDRTAPCCGHDYIEAITLGHG